MNIFHSNITNTYGEKGKARLDEVPELVSAISSRLDLRDLKEVANLTYNYVLSIPTPNVQTIKQLKMRREFGLFYPAAAQFQEFV
jgi:hypothetical protein